MESIFESLENLNISEECFDDIIGLVEEYLSEERSIMNLIKQGMTPEEAKEKYFDEKNKEFVKSRKDLFNAYRLENKANEKFSKELRRRRKEGFNKVGPDYAENAFTSAVKNRRNIEKKHDSLYDKQLRLRDTKAGKSRIVLPDYKLVGKYYATAPVGYQKDGKPFSP